MNFDEYQKEAHATAVYQSLSLDGQPIPWAYPVMKLCGEAGEVSEKFGKVIRDDKGVFTHTSMDGIIKEMGDVLWYLAEISTQLNLPLSMIAEANIEKLKDRRERGKIQGDGDSR